MRFLLLNQFYPPDPAPTGQYLHTLARALVERGHHVEVLCSRKAYSGRERFAARQEMQGVRVSRLPATGFGRRRHAGKLADYGTFYGALLWALIFRRANPDLILSLTTPPYVGLLGKLGAGKAKCPRAHWIMDLYPDVLLSNGMRSSIGARCLRGLTRLDLHGSACVVALGPNMAERIESYLSGNGGAGRSRDALAEAKTQSDEAVNTPSFRHAAGHKHSNDASTLWWLPLWSDPHLSPWSESDGPNPVRSHRGWRPDETVLLYSGNMGVGHRLQEFLQAAAAHGKQGPRWVFSGDGMRRVEVESFRKSHPLAKVDLLDYVPRSSLRAHLTAGDVHLASLDAAWAGLIVPSKIQASFAVGRPVLFVGSPHCEPAAWIRESRGGWVVGQNDVTALHVAVREATHAAERERRGQAAWAYAQSHFRQSANCGRLASLLEHAAVRNRPVDARRR